MKLARTNIAGCSTEVVTTLHVFAASMVVAHTPKDFGILGLHHLFNCGMWNPSCWVFDTRIEKPSNMSIHNQTPQMACKLMQCLCALQTMQQVHHARVALP